MSAICVFISSVRKEFAGERAPVHASATPPPIPGVKAQPESRIESEVDDIL
jgi:hypothetical protein